MNSRAAWSVEGIDPSVRERAEAAARRAGMSLSDWLNSTIGDSVPPNFRAPAEQRSMPPSQETPDVADIHRRLESLTTPLRKHSQPAQQHHHARTDRPRGRPASSADM